MLLEKVKKNKMNLLQNIKKGNKIKERRKNKNQKMKLY